MRRPAIVLGLLALAVLCAWLFSAAFESTPPPEPSRAAGSRPAQPSLDGEADESGPEVQRVERHAAAEPPEAPALDRARLRGRVLEEDSDKPLGGARVRIWTVARNAAELDLCARPPTAETRSGDDGRFELDVVRGVQSWIVATLAGHVPYIEDASLDEEVELYLRSADPATYIVVDSDGNPISGASVTVSVMAAVFSRHQTDDGGRLVLRCPDDASLLFEASGHATVEIGAEGDGETGRVVLPDGHPLGGEVADEDAAPLAGVAVTLQASGETREQIRQTDEHGRFRFENAPAGESLWVRAEAPGRVPTGGYGTAGRLDLRIVLPRARSVRGIVLLPDLSPAKEARVWPGGVIVGDDGRFELTAVPLETQHVVARLGKLSERPGFEGATQHRFDAVQPLTSSEDEELRLVLRELPTSHCRVRLLGADGEPMAGVKVRAWPGAARATTDDSGHADLNFAVGPDTRGWLSVDPPVWTFRGVTLDLVTRSAPGGDAVVFRVPERPQITVTVMHPDNPNAEPPEDMHVWLRASTPNVYPMQESKDGWQSTYRAPPGSSGDVIVRVPGVGSGTAQWSASEEGVQHVTVRLERWGSVRVVLTGADALTNAPHMFLSAAKEAYDGGWGSSTRLERDEDGAWTSDSVPAGTIYLQVRNNHVFLLEHRITLGPGETWSGTIELPAVRTLRGVIRSKDGKPLGGCHVFTRTGPSSPPPDAITGPDGRFSFTAARADGVFLTIRRKRYARFVRAIADIPDGELQIRLQPEGTVRVIYDPPSGGYGMGAYFRMPGTTFQLQPGIRQVPATEVPTGRFAIDFAQLPIGSVEVALKIGPEFEWHPVVVRPGEVVEVDIGAPGGR